MVDHLLAALITGTPTSMSSVSGGCIKRSWKTTGISSPSHRPRSHVCLCARAHWTTTVQPVQHFSLSFSLLVCLRSSYRPAPNTSLAQTHPEDACGIPDANVLEDRKDLQRRIQQSVAPASNVRPWCSFSHHLPRCAHSEHCLPKPTPGQNAMHRV